MSSIVKIAPSASIVYQFLVFFPLNLYLSWWRNSFFCQTSGKFRERGGGPVKIYGNSSYKTVSLLSNTIINSWPWCSSWTSADNCDHVRHSKVIQDLCALVSDDIEHLAGTFLLIFSCPSISRPTLVTHSLTHWLCWIQSLPAFQTKPKPCKIDGGHAKTWPDQQKEDNDKDKYKDNDNESNKYI